MTFETYETSIQSGSPVELYEFKRDLLAWRYTSADHDVTALTKTWLSVPMSRSRLETTATAEKTTLKITVARDNPVADLFRVVPPSDVVSITVYKAHTGDLSDVKTIWMGRINNCEWRGAEAVLNCEPASVSMGRNGLRRLYQRSCPHRLYGPACRLTRVDWEETGTVTVVNGKQITVPAADSFADGYFNGGVLEWTADSGAVERRTILDHTGGVLTLTLQVPGIPVGASVVMLPGCNHTLSVCQTKFSNTNNYGGFPYVPTKNPFTNSQAY